MLRRVGALRSTYVGEALNSEIYLPLSGNLIITEWQVYCKTFLLFWIFRQIIVEFRHHSTDYFVKHLSGFQIFL